MAQQRVVNAVGSDLYFRFLVVDPDGQSLNVTKFEIEKKNGTPISSPSWFVTDTSDQRTGYDGESMILLEAIINRGSLQAINPSDDTYTIGIGVNAGTRSLSRTVGWTIDETENKPKDVADYDGLEHYWSAAYVLDRANKQQVKPYTYSRPYNVSWERYNDEGFSESLMSYYNSVSYGDPPVFVFDSDAQTALTNGHPSVAGNITSGNNNSFAVLRRTTQDLFRNKNFCVITVYADGNLTSFGSDWYPGIDPYNEHIDTITYDRDWNVWGWAQTSPPSNYQGLRIGLADGAYTAPTEMTEWVLSSFGQGAEFRGGTVIVADFNYASDLSGTPSREIYINGGRWFRTTTSNYILTTNNSDFELYVGYKPGALRRVLESAAFLLPTQTKRAGTNYASDDWGTVWGPIHEHFEAKYNTPVVHTFDPKSPPSSWGLTLEGWYLADSITTGSDVSGGRLQTWRDRSGNGRNLTYGSDTDGPNYEATGWNGGPSLYFDGSGYSLSNNSFAIKEGCVFIVCECLADVNGATLVSTRTGSPYVRYANSTGYIPYSQLGSGGSSFTHDPDYYYTYPATNQMGGRTLIWSGSDQYRHIWLEQLGNKHLQWGFTGTRSFDSPSATSGMDETVWRTSRMNTLILNAARGGTPFQTHGHWRILEVQVWSGEVKPFHAAFLNALKSYKYGRLAQY